MAVGSRPIIACLDVFKKEVQLRILEVAGDQYTIRFAESESFDHQAGLVSNADFLLVGGAPVTRELLSGAKHCKFIQKWGIGVDKIDLDAVRERGIGVAITAGANARPVAELAILLMMAVYRRLIEMDRALREGIWMKPEARSSCFQITGKTVGLLGFGNIARMVAKRLSGFDVDLIYYDPYPADHETEQALNARLVSLDELLARSDILSLHTPLTPQTNHIINEKSLQRMRDGSVIVNTARGELIDEAALYAALQSGKLLGAGLDTFENEPPSTANPLLSFPRVVVTPHIGGGVLDNVSHVAKHALGNMTKFIAGEPLDPADVIVENLVRVGT